MQSVLDQTTRTLAPVSPSRRYQIAIEDLRLEMFVVELDRPWLDTPFLLQGFLVDSQVELDTLAKYCQYVYVDLDLSSPKVADAIRRAAIHPASEVPAKPATAANRFMTSSVATGWTRPSAPAKSAEHAESKSARRPQTPATGADTTAPQVIARAAAAAAPQKKKRYRQRADIQISRDTRQRFRQMVKQSSEDKGGGVLDRMFGWLINLSGQERRFSAPAGAAPATDLFPTGIHPTRHRNSRAMTEELPRARQAFERSEEVLNSLVQDIRSGKTLSVESVAGAVDSMVDSMLSNPDALMWIARLREEDITTYNHGVKVSLHLVALGRHLGFPRKELAYLGQIGMLADVGKTKLPKALLEKPGMLSPSEYALVKEHVNLALHVLGDGPELPKPVLTGIAQHHERMDGSGYPNGLSGNQISIYGRMAAIADSFAALITPRPYANASAPQDALLSLYEWSGTSFHGAMVEQFVQAVGVFPVGSMVELNSGEVAVVVAHNRARRLEPKVLMLSTPDKRPLAQPVERDLMRDGKKNGADKGEKPTRIARGLAAGAYGFKLRDYYLDEAAKQNGIVS